MSDVAEGKYSGQQVVTELDSWIAMCDYIAIQLEGRFRVEFPEHAELAHLMIGPLRDPYVRMNTSSMEALIKSWVSQLGMALTECSLIGCDNEETHAFEREFVNLIWDARAQTGEWLRRQGIVPGQSAN